MRKTRYEAEQRDRGGVSCNVTEPPACRLRDWVGGAQASYCVRDGSRGCSRCKVRVDSERFAGWLKLFSFHDLASNSSAFIG